MRSKKAGYRAYRDEPTDLEPGLAESWQISSDGKTYTFCFLIFNSFNLPKKPAS